MLEATLSRIGERDSELNSIVDRFASESAQMLNEAPEGPLHGVPVAVKDMFALPWRAPRDGSVRNMTGVEAGESAVYRRLRDAGAVVVGVTNMHEHGAGSTGHISAYGPCGNPWDPARCGGGSSGGSAAAVGARLVAGAVGTDGGGSIRYPAAYCGVTGLKLTWGLVPSDGYTHAYSSMSAPGPLCRDTGDARLLAEALVGRPLEARRAQRLRLGVVPALWEDVDPEIAELCQSAVDELREAGMTVTEVSLEGIEHVRIATVLRLWLEDAAAVPPQTAREHEPDLSPIGRALSKYRTLIPAEALVRADAVRATLRRSLVDAGTQADVLVWPTVAAPAPAIEDTDRAASLGTGSGRLRERPDGRHREPDRRARAVGAGRPDARRASGRPPPDDAVARPGAPARRRRTARAGHGPPARGRRAPDGTDDAGV